LSLKKSTIDLQLHMAVKAFATLQGEINCKIDELVKKAILLQEKEAEEEVANYFLEMISDNLDDLRELFKQRTKLCDQIENLKKTEMDLMKE
jgi:acid stress-induced BolA-like protein IbaG/YrbA